MSFKENSYKKELLVLIIMLFMSLSSIALIIRIHNNTCYEACESLKLYSHKLNHTIPQFGVRGVYFSPENYYCVDLDNSEQQVKKTECHEVCHSLVRENYEHFCK